MADKTDSTIKITPKLILIFLIGLGSPLGTGIWWLSNLESKLNHTIETVNSIPSSDNSEILERIKAVEVLSNYNEKKGEKLDADIEKLVEHLNRSLKQIESTINSNPLSLGN